MKLEKIDAKQYIETIVGKYELAWTIGTKDYFKKRLLKEKLSGILIGMILVLGYELAMYLLLSYLGVKL